MVKMAEFGRELEKIEDEEILIVLAEAGVYQKTNLEVLSYLVGKKDHDCVYIALNKPYDRIVQVLKKNKIDHEKFFFIDTISETIYGKKKEEKNVIYVSSPHGLTELSISLNKAINSLESKKKFIFLDSISTLLVYNQSVMVTKFAHFLVGRTLASKMKGVLMSLKKETDPALVNHLSQFVDKVIEVSG